MWRIQGLPTGRGGGRRTFRGKELCIEGFALWGAKERRYSSDPQIWGLLQVLRGDGFRSLVLYTRRSSAETFEHWLLVDDGE